MGEETGRATRPGQALLDVVAVMDRLRAPGGCPWDAEQTHASLTRYLLEETYEVIDAVAALPDGGVGGGAGTDAAGGPGEGPSPDQAEADLAEELGDVLLQVVFHARVAAERGAFDVDDVARGLVAKLVRRHPHVFADEQVRSGAAVQARWDELKAAEKPARGPVDGIPRHLPALARADKLLSRLERAGLDTPGPDTPGPDTPGPDTPRPDTPGPDTPGVTGDGSGADEHVVREEPGAGRAGQELTAAAVGDALFALVRRARAAGVDPEAALRAHVDAVEHAAAGGTGPAY